MSTEDGHNRSEAERVSSEQQWFAAIDRDREHVREAWREDRQIRYQFGPIVGFGIFMLLMLGVLLGRVGGTLWIIAGIVLILVAIAAILRGRLRAEDKRRW